MACPVPSSSLAANLVTHCPDLEGCAIALIRSQAGSILLSPSGIEHGIGVGRQHYVDGGAEQGIVPRTQSDRVTYTSGE